MNSQHFTSTEQSRYVLHLYIAGMSPRSMLAIRRVRDFCQKHLPQRYELEIIDIHQKPERMKDQQIITIPTLIKVHPMPICGFIGDLYNDTKLLNHLNILPIEQ